jgi:predicted HAD superfamily hydrolase
MQLKAKRNQNQLQIHLYLSLQLDTEDDIQKILRVVETHGTMEEMPFWGRQGLFV